MKTFEYWNIRTIKNIYSLYFILTRFSKPKVVTIRNEQTENIFGYWEQVNMKYVMIIILF